LTCGFSPLALRICKVERVEQAFRPAVKAGKIPASAAEVLPVDSLPRRNHRIYLLCHR
jgi:hypothetical protein